MKNRIHTLILLLFAVQLSFAQVKRQYQDEVFSQTIVVVKDDQAQDADILNQFDLDDIGMDQVIRITTEIPEVSTPKTPVSNPVPKVVASKPIVEMAPEDRKPKAKRWTKRQKKVAPIKKALEDPIIAEVEKPVEKEAINRGGKDKERSVRSNRKVRKSSKSRKVRTKKKSKRKNRRLKKAKRKKYKGKKYSCFTF